MGTHGIFQLMASVSVESLEELSEGRQHHACVVEAIAVSEVSRKCEFFLG